MAKKHSDRVPKNVPIIKVRQQWTTKCGTTCTGQGYDGEKRYPPCGPTPPSSAPADNTCGLPDCVEVPTCRCRCSCAIKELLRERAQAPASRGTTPNETFYTSQEQIPQVHVAQILTLEPRCHRWFIYGGAPVEPCRGGRCFFGSPARAFNPTGEVLGELPEWNLEPIKTLPVIRRRNKGMRP